MGTRFSYENIWLRNAGVYVLIFCGLLLDEILSSQNTQEPLTLPEMVGYFSTAYTIAFINNHFIVRKLLLKKKYLYYTIVLIAYLACVGWLFMILNESDEHHSVYLSEVFSGLLFILFSTGLYFVHLWFVEDILSSKRKLMNTQNELNFLKQQLNPHFLLNAMNNLYGTALVDPTGVAEKILDLSELLRYQLEATSKKLISLDEEIEFTNRYLDYVTYKTNDLEVNVTTKGVKKSFQVPPLLFLPLVENAAKYAVEVEKPKINIAWNFQADHLSCLVENTYLQNNSKVSGTKIGLANLERRLQINGCKYVLTKDQKWNGFFKIELKLWASVTAA